MTPRSILVVMLALTCGGSAAVGINKFMADRPVLTQSVEMAPVVMALVDIPRGSAVAADQIKVRDFPKSMVAPGMLAKVEDVVNRAVIIPLVKDELVLENKLAPKGQGPGIAPLVRKGMRAFTIHMPNVSSSVAGFILPGNTVDVLLTIDGKHGPVTTTFLQNLEILAVDQRIDAPAEARVDPSQLRSATLQVTPAQATKLGLAQTKGTLQLSLRNLKDDQTVDASPARLAELDGLEEEVPAPVVAEAPKPAPPPPPPPTPKYVTVYRGISSWQMYPVNGGPAVRPAAPGADAGEPRDASGATASEATASEATASEATAFGPVRPY